MSLAVCLSIQDRRVYIIGGGPVAYRKYKSYQKEGAQVCVIAPQLCDAFNSIADLNHIANTFSWTYIAEDAFLIYAATNDQVLNQAIIEEAKKRHILTGCAHQGVGSDIQSMAIWKGEGLYAAISTQGHCPGADQSFLAQMEEQLEELDQRTLYLGRLRSFLFASTRKKEDCRDILIQASRLSVSYLASLISCLQGKKALLFAYHGIARVERIATHLACTQQEVEAQYPDYTVFSLFLSQKITEKAKRKGHSIEHIQTITALLDALSIPYLLQPVLLQDGHWYRELQTMYPAHNIGEAICTSKEDVDALIEALSVKNITGNQLFLYHPSEASLFQNLQHPAVYFCSMESEPPKIPSTDVLHVIACCIFCGYHVERDILQTWLPRLKMQYQEVILHKQGLLETAQGRACLYKKTALLIASSN